MSSQLEIISIYDSVANEYATYFFNELSRKHFDRLILKAFAEENKEKGRCIDFGCGPGQTTKFLIECGVKDIIGADISPAMIAKAKELNPQLSFEVADMLNLKYKENSIASAIAFYAIVNFTLEEVKIALNEINRALKSGGEFLFSFHIGSEIKHVDNFLDKPVSIDFYFFETRKIVQLLIESQFKIIDVVEREPYKDVEYPSKRAYVWVKK